MGQPSQSDRPRALPAATVRVDALILATICEQLRVELTRPPYARLENGGADRLAATLGAALDALYALHAAPDRADAAALLIEGLDRILDVGQHMRAVADAPWSARPLNSAPKLHALGRGEAEARPLDLLLRQVKAQRDELRALVEEPEPMTARPRDSRFDSRFDLPDD
jgi:hypothetical protein